MHDGEDTAGKTPDSYRDPGADEARDFNQRIQELKTLVEGIEKDPRYSGYLVTTVCEGDCIIIGDSIVRLKKVKSTNKISLAVKAFRHVLVRRFSDKDECGQEETL